MIVVTGGAGFIGSNLVAGLEDADLGPVSVVDRLGRDEKWKNLRRRDLDELVDPSGLDDFLLRRERDITYVVHMGAISATTETDADLIVDTNLRLSQQVWRWCAQHAVPLIYASSAATYGDGSAGFDDDASPEALSNLLPMNAYGWSKHAFDRWVVRTVQGNRPRPPQWVGLKFFNVYGPNEHHKRGMSSVVTKAFPDAARGRPVQLFRSHHPDYPDGGQKRDFIYVKDCVDVMIWLMEHRQVNGLFNLGTGRAQTWVDLMGALYAAVGKEMKVRWVDTPEEIRDRYQYFTQADMGRLRNVGYDRPFLPVEEGVADYVKNHLLKDDPYR
jgi:ADP-L-glycero-D-manno-heptose 6-epimerase